MTTTSRLRWWLALAGLMLGAVDVTALGMMGISFSRHGEDLRGLAFGYLGSGFAAFGWLLGSVIEGRRRERLALARLEELRERITQTEKLALLGELAAAIAHEVRNPLAIIRSSVQNAEESLPPGELAGRKSCSFALEEIDRLTRVTSSLLGFARPIRVRAAPIDLGELFDRIEGLTRRMLEKKALHLDRRGADPALVAELDADLVCQVLLGLIANAADATPREGTVFLEARREGGALELTVADTGPGVPPELPPRIFEPFVTTRGEGTGLGLAVAKQLVEAQGGKIQVGDRPGGGACFSIRFEAHA